MKRTRIASSGHCCRQCGFPLYLGERALEDQGEVFCSIKCGQRFAAQGDLLAAGGKEVSEKCATS